jgi:glutamate/tyrosine decarboxylase-like PLP-dependent enzyme
MRDEASAEGRRRGASPADMSGAEFRRLGHLLVDRIGEFFESLPDRRITPGESPKSVRARIRSDGLPQRGTPADTLLGEAVQLLFDHSLHNGHPRFLGYITSSAAPLGALADLLASAVNANLGKWDLAPIACEIERQTVGWLAELIGYPTSCGGLMVSGGNMANLHGFMAARRAKIDWDVRAGGVRGGAHPTTVYASRETHTWIEKAADTSGLGTQAIRWIDTDEQLRIDVGALVRRIQEDRAAGCTPLLVVGTAGNVSTGAVDPLDELADLCEAEDLWFHVDGAYGAPAAALPEAAAELKALSRADSVALDPHKWLYSPLEAGCTLVRDPATLENAFSFQPAYYHFAEGAADEPGLNYYELGFQNSRRFRALKVWLGLRHLGREGYTQLIREDIALAGRLHARVATHPELEALTQHLSITTFRYVPDGVSPQYTEAEAYLNQLNQVLLDEVQRGGEFFVSNAILDGRYALRSCIVNFRTGPEDIDAMPEAIARVGRALDARLRPEALR